MRPLLDHKLYTIAWIAILPIEVKAALAALDKRHDGVFPTVRGDDYTYIGGEIEGHNVVIAKLPAGQQYGVGSAAALVKETKARFENIWYALLVGVAAGLPDYDTSSNPRRRDIRLGDVIVCVPDKHSTGVVHYDIGHDTEAGFVTNSRQTEPPNIVRSAIFDLQLMPRPFKSGNQLALLLEELQKTSEDDDFRHPGQEQDILYKRCYDEGGAKKETEVERALRDELEKTRVWYGRIGSGNSLMKNPKRKDELREQFDLVGLEMEAAGVMNTLPTGVIRGICDYADGHKADDWQPYAAAVAAVYAKALLQQIPPKVQNVAQNPNADFSLNLSLPGALETTNFVAREAELSDIHVSLTGRNLRRYVVLQGLGGIGKTQLAVAYAVRHKDNYSAVFWLDASSNDSIVSSFVKVAKQILRAFPDTPQLASLDLDKDLDNVVDGIKAWLSMPANTRWLLICDNYDNPKVSGNTDTGAVDLIQYLPEDYHGSVLITTRSFEVTLGHCMRIKKLDVRDGLKILEHSSRRGDLTSDSGALAVAEKLDGLPLALATAGAFLSQNRWSWEKYLGHLNESWAKLQISSPQLRTYENRTLFTTWQISFEQIEQRSSIAANLLRLWAYFDNQDLWFELLAHGTDETPQWLKQLTEDELGFERHMRVLCNHGLAEANERNVYVIESAGYSVHACVHDWVIAVLNADYDVSLARVALERIASHVPRNPMQGWSFVQRRLLRHASRSKEGLARELNDDHGLAWVCECLGNLYANQDKLEEAEEMYKRALTGCEKALGADHLSTLGTVNSLGQLYAARGKFGEAEEMYDRALSRYAKAPGADHKSIMNTVNNFGNLYSAQGKLERAEEMYERALRGFETALDTDCSSILEVVHNLGNLYVKQGKLVEAEEMYKRALSGKDKMFGMDHTSTLSTLNSLGVLYAKQGKLEKAMEKYNTALRGRMEALGSDHTSTLGTVHNLGKLYYLQGKLGEAEKMFMRALEGKEKTLGADHTSTLDTVNILGNLYSVQGKLEEAEKMYLRELEGREKAPGAGHTSTFDTVNHLGGLYYHQGKLGEAQKMYLRALRGKEEVLGAYHHSTIKSLIYLSQLRIDQHRFEEARALYERAKSNYRSISPSLQGYVDGLEESLANAHDLSPTQGLPTTTQDTTTDRPQSTSTIPIESAGLETPAKKAQSRLKAFFRRR